MLEQQQQQHTKDYGNSVIFFIHWASEQYPIEERNKMKKTTSSGGLSDRNSFCGGCGGGDLVGERDLPARPSDKRSTKMRTLV